MKTVRNLLNVLGTNKSTNKPNKPKRGALRLLLMLVAVVAMSGNVWGAWSGSGSGTQVNGVWYALYDNTERNIKLSLLGAHREYNYKLSAPGSVLTFDSKREKNEAVGYLTVAHNGTDPWTVVFSDRCGNDYGNSGNLSISTAANELSFYSDYGSYKRYFKNVHVTMATYFEDPSVSSLDFGSADINTGSVSKTFTIAWCNTAAITYSFSSNPSNVYSVSISSNASVGKYGTATVTVTYNRDIVAGTHNPTLTLSSGGVNKTVSLTAETRKLNPTITWSSDDEIFNVGDELSATNINGLTVSLSGDGNYVSCSGNKATMTNVVASTTVTATITGNAVYNDATFPKAIQITSKQKQTITWNQTFDQLQVGGASITLNATASSGLPCTYTLDESAAGVASLTQNGNTWTLNILGEGETFIYAHQAGNTQWAAASDVEKYVLVYDPSNPCSTGGQISGKFQVYDGDPKYFTVYTPATITIRAHKNSGVTTGKRLKVKQLVGSDWIEIFSDNCTSSYVEYPLSDVNNRATQIEVSTDANNGYILDWIKSTRYTNVSSATTSVDFQTYPGTVEQPKNITINHSNTRVFLSMDQNESNFSITPISFGSCGAFGDQVVSVGYTAPTATGHYTGHIYVKDNTGALKQTINLSADVQKVEQTVDFTNLQSSYNTTDHITLTATSNKSGAKNFVYSASPSDIAEFNGSVMTFKKSGTFAITVTEIGDDVYQPGSKTVTGVVVNKVTPTITTPPTAAAITYGQTLGASALSGGSATTTYHGTPGSTVLGTFTWHEASAVKTANYGEAQSYQVDFTPNDGGMYNSTTCQVSVLINRANQTITWNDDFSGAEYYATKDLTASAIGAITYSATAGTVDLVSSTKIRYTSVGSVTLQAAAAATADYSANTATKTLNVAKGTPAISWASGTYYTDTTYAASNIYSVTNGDGNLIKITASSDQDVARVLNDGANVKFFNKLSSTTLTIKATENAYWKGGTWTKSITPVTAAYAFTYTEDFFNFDAITTYKTGSPVWSTTQHSTSGKLILSCSSCETYRSYVGFQFSGTATKISYDYSNSGSQALGTFAVYGGAVGPEGTMLSKHKPANNDWRDTTVNLSGGINYLQWTFANNPDGGDFSHMRVYGNAYILATDSTAHNFQILRKDHPATITVQLAHANLGYVSTVSSDNPEFYVSLDNVNFAQSVELSTTDNPVTGGGLQGVLPIYIKYRTSAEGVHNGTITISDNNSHSTTISVSGETQDKLSTRVEWIGKPSEYVYSSADGKQNNPFRVVDANGQVVSGVLVTYTSSNPEVAFVDNATWQFTPLCGDRTTLTGSYAGNAEYKPSQLAHEILVEQCEQYIDWTQPLMSFVINPGATLTEPLTAQALNYAGGSATGATITYTITEGSSIASIVDNGGGSYSLQLTGKGSAKIRATASATATFASTSTEREIRVRQQGEKCGSIALDQPKEKSLDDFNKGDVYAYTVPGETLTYLIRKEYGLTLNAEVVLSGSPNNVDWTEIERFTLDNVSSEQHTQTVNETYRYIRWTCGADLENAYRLVKNVQINQLAYLRPSVDSLKIKAYINMPIEGSFSLDYSDQPYISCTISDAGGNGLTITRDEADNNDCGDWGTYHYHVTSSKKWDMPKTIDENITIQTVAGDVITIPVHISIDLGGTYIFTDALGDGDWGKTGNWSYGGSIPTELPKMMNQVIIEHPVRLSTNEEVYQLQIIVDVQSGKDGYVTIAPTGGLTVYNGGIGQLDSKLTIESSEHNVGYFRVAPSVVADWKAPLTATVKFATKSTLDTGADKDATWQYFGPAVNGVNFTANYETWLYDWSEQEGWVNLKDGQAHALQPFHGYVITQYGKPTYDFTGELLMGNYDLTLTKTATGMQGSNIIVNSYPAPIDVNKFTAEDFDAGIQQTFYLYNSGSWNDWKAGKDSTSASGDRTNTPGTYYAIPVMTAKQLPDCQTIIPSMNGIYVVTTEDGAQIHLNYAKHVWQATAADMHLPLRSPARRTNMPIDTIYQDTVDYAAQLSHRVVLNISSNNSGTDRVSLLENPKDTHYTPNYDNGYDASKIGVGGVVNIFTTENSGYYSVSATNRLDSMYIGVLTGEDNTYQLTVSHVVGDSLYLKDQVTNAEIPLMDGQTYNFNMTPNSENDYRFIILRRHTQPFVPTSNYDVHSDAYIWAESNILHIENAGANSAVVLYAADGKLLYSETIHHRADISIDQLAESMYLVYVDGKPFKFVKK